MKKIALKFGTWMLFGFVAFFLIMHLLDLSQNYWLRVFNGVIHLSIIYAAVRSYRVSHPESLKNPVSGVALGMYTSLIGVVGFAIFMLLFMVYSPNFLDNLQSNFELGKYLNPITATIFLLAEGIAISLIGSYILTRIIDMRMLNEPK